MSRARPSSGNGSGGVAEGGSENIGNEGERGVEEFGGKGQHEAIWLKLNTCEGSWGGIQICQITI